MTPEEAIEHSGAMLDAIERSPITAADQVDRVDVVAAMRLLGVDPTTALEVAIDVRNLWVTERCEGGPLALRTVKRRIRD